MLDFIFALHFKFVTPKQGCFEKSLATLCWLLCKRIFNLSVKCKIHAVAIHETAKSFIYPLYIFRYYTRNSFNSRTYGECVESIRGGQRKHWSTANNASKCADKGGTWVDYHSYLELDSATTEPAVYIVEKLLCDIHVHMAAIDQWFNRNIETNDKMPSRKTRYKQA